MAKGKKKKVKNLLRRQNETEMFEKKEMHDGSSALGFSQTKLKSFFKPTEVEEVNNILGIEDFDEALALIAAAVLGRSDLVRRFLRDGCSLESTDQCVRNLGLIFDETLSWRPYVNRVCQNVFAKLHPLRKLQRSLPPPLKRKLILTLILPIFDYCDVVYTGITEELSAKLERMHNHGRTPYLWAVRCMHLNLIDLLTEKGADRTVKDSSGDNALVQVLTGKAWEEEKAVEYYMTQRKYFDANCKNKAGNTPLYLAVLRHWTAMCQALLDHGAHVNTTNAQGKTALILAAAKGFNDMAALLLAHRADVLQEDERGCTALCHSISWAFKTTSVDTTHKVVELLLFQLSREQQKKYLTRRLDMLRSAELRRDTVKFFLSPILTFFGRSVAGGLEDLCRHGLFNCLAKGLTQHTNQPQHVVCMLETLSTLLLCCDCCVSQYNPGFAEGDLYAYFFSSDCPEACFTLLDTTADDTLTCAALAPFILACPADRYGRSWLLTHCCNMLSFYQKFVETGTMKYTCDSNETHGKIFKKRVKHFKNLFAKYMNADDKKCTKEKSIGSEKSNEDSLKHNSRDTSSSRHKGSSPERSESMKTCLSQDSDTSREACTNSKKEKSVQVHACSDKSLVSEDDKSVISEIINSITSQHGEFEGFISESVGQQQGKDLSLSMEYLQALFEQTITKVRRSWTYERLHDYPEHRTPREEDDAVYLMKMKIVLPQLEDYYMSKLCMEWNAIIHTATEEKWTDDDVVVKLYKIMTRITEAFGDKSTTDHDESQLQSHSSSSTKLGDRSDPSVTVLFRSKDFTPKSSSEIWRGNGNPLCLLSELRGEEEACWSDEYGEGSRWGSKLSHLRTKILTEAVRHGDIWLPDPVKCGTVDLSVSDCGHFGPVQIGMDTNGRPVAVKHVQQFPASLHLLSSMAQRLRSITCKYLLGFYLSDDPDPVIAAPLMNANLGEYIHTMKQNQSSNNYQMHIIKQMILGLHFLHTQNPAIVHGNLKPANIFINSYGTVKVAEFGLSSALYLHQPAPTNSMMWWPYEVINTYVQLKRLQCSLAADISTTGMLIHFILSGGKHPSGSGVDDIIRNLLVGQWRLTPLAADAFDLITWMLVTRPHKRPCVQGVIRHMFFWSKEKKWKFLLTCAGVSVAQQDTHIISCLHSFINFKSEENSIYGDWRNQMITRYPSCQSLISQFSPSLTGLLQFVRRCLQQQAAHTPSSPLPPAADLQFFLLSVLPTIFLSVYRMIEGTQWMHQIIFEPYN